MKKLLLFALFSFAISVLHAQEKPSDGAKNLQKLKDLLKQNNLHLNKNDKGLLTFNLDQKPVFLYETNKGKVYANPLDKMRILAPKYNSNMPVAKNSPGIYIPNPIPREDYNLELNLGAPPTRK